MKNILQPFALLCLTLLIPLIGSSAEKPADAKAPAAPDALSSTNPPPVSVFKVESRPTARDPFFPKSDRRKKVVGVPGSTNVSPANIPAPILNFKAYLGDLVMINDQVFAKGEEKPVTVANKQKIKVRLVEIRKLENVIVVSVEGSKDLMQLKLKGK